MKNIGQKMITAVPWVLAVAYLVPAPFIAGQSSEGWGYLILEIITYPASILFAYLHSVAHTLIIGDPMTNDRIWTRDAYVWVRFLIYVGGGTLWFFGIGLVIRWVLRRVFRSKNTTNQKPNQALHATSETAPGADSSSHQGRRQAPRPRTHPPNLNLI